MVLVKNPPANTGDIRVVGSIPGSGRSPGAQQSKPLQYSNSFAEKKSPRTEEPGSHKELDMTETTESHTNLLI